MFYRRHACPTADLSVSYRSKRNYLACTQRDSNVEFCMYGRWGEAYYFLVRNKV